MTDSTPTPASAGATVAAAAQALDALDTAAPADDTSKRPDVAKEARLEGDEPTAEELAAAELAAEAAALDPAPKKTEEEDAAEKQAAEDAAQAAAQKAAERHSLKIDGEERQLTLDELKELASKGGDYTRKSQQNAEIRKQAETELAQHRTARQQYAEGLVKVKTALDAVFPAEPNWTQVRAERPDTYAQEFADFQVLKQNRDALTAEQNRVAQEEADDRLAQRAEILHSERERLHAAVPEFRDPVKGPELQAKMYVAAERYGFTHAQVDDTSSAALLLMLNDARKYHEIVAARKTLDVKLKAAAAAAAVAEPGSAKLPTAKPGSVRAAIPPNQKAAESALATLRQTHSLSDAAAALDAMDL
jgi:hypothetical protein